MADRRSVIVAILLLALLVGAAPALAQTTPSSPTTPAAPADLNFMISVKPQYTEGTYGTSTTTRVLYVPFLFEWDVTDRFNVDLTIPYIWQRGQGVLGTLGTGPFRPRGGGVSERRQGHGHLDRHAAVRTESGLGDIFLEGNYRLVDERSLIPEITGVAAIKFPTADDSKGLGTGQFDELLGVELRKKLGDRWTALVDLSYTFVGSPDNLHLDNSFSWSLGAGYDLTRALRLSGYLEGATAVAPGEADPLDVRFMAAYDLTRALQLTGSVLRGLTDGAPDFGASVGFAVRF